MFRLLGTSRTQQGSAKKMRSRFTRRYDLTGPIVTKTIVQAQILRQCEARDGRTPKIWPSARYYKLSGPAHASLL